MIWKNYKKISQRIGIYCKENIGKEAWVSKTKIIVRFHLKAEFCILLTKWFKCIIWSDELNFSIPRDFTEQNFDRILEKRVKHGKAGKLGCGVFFLTSVCEKIQCDEHVNANWYILMILGKDNYEQSVLFGCGFVANRIWNFVGYLMLKPHS